MEESRRGADHTQTSWEAADRCHESTAVIHTARMEGGEERRGEERRGERGSGWDGVKWREGEKERGRGHLQRMESNEKTETEVGRRK